MPEFEDICVIEYKACELFVRDSNYFILFNLTSVNSILYFFVLSGFDQIPLRYTYLSLVDMEKNFLSLLHLQIRLIENPMYLPYS